MKRYAAYIYIIGVILLLASCTMKTVFSEYTHAQVEGWEKNDDVVFHVPGVKEAGEYQEDLGLRITSGYPFMRLTLVVTSRYYESGQHKPYAEQKDTLRCELLDQRGVTKGQGVGVYQYHLPVTARQLNEGDSLTVSVRHDMKREILPGVCDIGLQLSRLK